MQSRHCMLYVMNGFFDISNFTFFMKISLLHHVPPPDGFIVVVVHLYHHHPAFTPLDSTFVKKISMMNKRPPYQMGLEKSQSNLSSRNKPLIKPFFPLSVFMPFSEHS